MNNLIQKSSRQYMKIWILICVLFLSMLVLPSTWSDTGFKIDPAKAAEAENNMWKAYYSRDLIVLRVELVDLLRSQFDLSYVEALDIGEDITRAAMTFTTTGDDYRRTVLPDLIYAYTKLKYKLVADFDPIEAASAELNWWVARRTPGKDSAEEVGKLIAHLYAVVFGGNQSMFERAGMLRAQAATLRDRDGELCDWNNVESLLLESYQALRDAHNRLTASQEKKSSGDQLKEENKTVDELDKAGRGERKGQVTSKAVSQITVKSENKSVSGLDIVRKKKHKILVSSQEEVLSKLETKVRLSVSGDQKIKDLIENGVVKKFVSDGGVVMTNSAPDWIIKILARETVIKGEKRSIIASVVILKPFGSRIIALANSHKESSMRELVRLHDQKLYHSIYNIDKLCFHIVVDFRNRHLNPEREKYQRIQAPE